MIKKKYNYNSFNLYTVKTDRFKTCHMQIIFYKSLDKNNITKENVLADTLCYTSKKYKKRNDVIEHLEDLYNASFYASCNIIGNVRTISFNYNFIDPIYADKNYLKEVIKFPFEMIFNPNIKNNEFDNTTLKIVKNKIKSDIESIKDNSSTYCLKQAIINTDENAPSSIIQVGNINDLNKINQENLVETYNSLLNDYYCDIYLIGNLDMEKVSLMIKDLFENDIIKTEKLEPSYKLNVKKYKNIEQTDNFEQSTLINIYNILELSEFEKFYVMIIFNILFGSSSLSNKLSQNLREKNSLCYFCESAYQTNENYLIVFCEIDKKNKNKALSLIKKSLNEMVKGNFSESDLNNAIKLAINSIKTSLDNPYAILNNYFFYNLKSVPLFKERLDKIETVSKKDVIEVAKKIKLVTTYFMKGK